MPITVLVADDHDVIREGIKSIVNQHSEYKIVAEASDGQKVKELVEQFKPDILLLDITMPEISGLDIIKYIQRVSSQTKIIIISVHKAGAYVIRALRLGINGYINKDCVVEELIPALRRIQRGNVYLGAEIADYIAQTIGEVKSPASLAIQVLSEREQDILRLVAEGKTAKEIARVLYLSRRTVENYKNSILKKLNLHKTSELIKYAIKNKIIDSA